MKPFNLEAALAGEPVVLRNGAKAFVIKRLVNPLCRFEALIGYQLIADNEYENPLTWSEEGAQYEDCEAYLDIIGMWEELKPTIKIGDMDVPEQERKPLTEGETYYVPYLNYSDMVDSLRWDNDTYDLRALKRGLVHRTKEAAEQHAKALIAFTASEEGKND